MRDQLPSSKHHGCPAICCFDTAVSLTWGGWVWDVRAGMGRDALCGGDGLTLRGAELCCDGQVKSVNQYRSLLIRSPYFFAPLPGTVVLPLSLQPVFGLVASARG